MTKLFDEKQLSEYKQFIMYEKITYTKGYIYLLKDSVFPNHIKIGKTINLVERLKKYNRDKPYATARFIYISKVFINKDIAEQKILEYIYSNIPSTTFTHEWFEVINEKFILETIQSAEKELE